MKLDYGIDRVDIIFHDEKISIDIDYDCIGEKTYNINYKGTGVFFHELPTIKEAVMYAHGVNAALLKYKPNLRGAEYE